jgi:hypothetical protein
MNPWWFEVSGLYGDTGTGRKMQDLKEVPGLMKETKQGNVYSKVPKSGLKI